MSTGQFSKVWLVVSSNPKNSSVAAPKGPKFFYVHHLWIQGSQERYIKHISTHRLQENLRTIYPCPYDTAWWLSQPPLWKMMDFVSWNDDIPNIWGKIKFMFQTTSQISIWYLNTCPTSDFILGHPVFPIPHSCTSDRRWHRVQRCYRKMGTPAATIFLLAKVVAIEAIDDCYILLP